MNILPDKQYLNHPVAHYLAWIGVSLFATFCMDLWGMLLHFTIGTPLANYALLGRYVLTAIHHGSIIVPGVVHIPKLEYENLIGWLVHIFIGLVDTYIYMIIIFKILKTTPHLLTSLFIGWLLLLMPLLIEQPMLGMGLAARLTPDPEKARLVTFSYHTVFGLSLFVGSVIFHRIFILMTHLNSSKTSKKKS